MQHISFPFPLLTFHTAPLFRLPKGPETPKGNGTHYNHPKPATLQSPKHLTSTGSSSKAPHSSGPFPYLGYGMSCPYLLPSAPWAEHFPAQDSRGWYLVSASAPTIASSNPSGMAGSSQPQLPTAEQWPQPPTAAAGVLLQLPAWPPSPTPSLLLQSLIPTRERMMLVLPYSTLPLPSWVCQDQGTRAGGGAVTQVLRAASCQENKQRSKGHFVWRGCLQALPDSGTAQGIMLSPCPHSLLFPLPSLSSPDSSEEWGSSLQACAMSQKEKTQTAVKRKKTIFLLLWEGWVFSTSCLYICFQVCRAHHFAIQNCSSDLQHDAWRVSSASDGEYLPSVGWMAAMVCTNHSPYRPTIKSSTAKHAHASWVKEPLLISLLNAQSQAKGCQ